MFLCAELFLGQKIEKKTLFRAFTSKFNKGAGWKIRHSAEKNDTNK